MNENSSSKKEQKAAPVQGPEEKGSSRPRWVQVRLFPILLRVIIVLALAAGSLTIGLMVGYGIIGDGKPQDALKKETWTHIIDIVKQDTE
ncbi:DNA-directed RNA polymerase subunit beta [Jeotgalibacillus sp. S-D1]|uniref:DNA-directed RNA polymerase subunit beta n=1 Tax=Jeotgalibacillus sp. S-D1 TaxID=2552189 RepID=UPI001059A3BB|nr:DNA-directed RNA polymerase subunit beta [Jeotgalibacillus sp. S-D1]TDL32898.1 DNA-directed RNA polymerase subunit beta [Jeotgalibacillus sp. S-D1]